MAPVGSLSRTLLLQFAIFVVPVALIFLYQAVTDLQRAERVKFELQGGLLAEQAYTSYKIFLNGAVDAVDTGLLSKRALGALEQSAQALSALQSREPAPQVALLLGSLDTLLVTARGNPSLKDLLPLRTVANRVDRLLAELVGAHKLRERRNIEKIAEDTKKQVWLTSVMLAFVIGLVFLLIKRLTEPLRRAVALAEAVAAGDYKTAKTIDTRRDLGGLLTSLAAMRDNLRQAFLDLATNEKRLSNAQRIASVGDWEIDVASGSLTRSDGVYQVFRREGAELTGPSIIPPEIVHPEDRKLVEESFDAARRRGEDFGIDFRVVLPNGKIRFVHVQSEVVHNDAGKPVKIAGTIQDITLRKNAEQQIRHLSLHDGLTGLPNRRYFEEQLAREFALVVRQDHKLAVFFLDLDRFKSVNDTLGHQVGDRLLKETADRITKSLRGNDIAFRDSIEPSDSTLARTGGDEFIALVTHLNHVEDSARVAQRILDSLTQPFEFDGNEVSIGVSIGIALCPMDGASPEDLLKNADIAMYHAKAAGGNNYQFFKESLKQEASSRLSLEGDLRKALVEDQFILHYQPQIDIATRNIYGVEALIRWRHPQRGMVPPLDFIPLAEECGMIVPISEWVLRTACAQVNAWHQAGLSRVCVAVNMASPAFSRANLIEVIGGALERSGLDARYLELELTESIMMHSVETVLQTLKQLKEMGVSLSMDDFGTGYSSLSYLQRFPIDKLKIDGSFVKNLDNPAGSAIVLAIISMAKALNLKLVAEGVETEKQEEFLLENGCASMQGYLFSRPLPADEMTRLLQKQKDPTRV